MHELNFLEHQCILTSKVRIWTGSHGQIHSIQSISETLGRYDVYGHIYVGITMMIIVLKNSCNDKKNHLVVKYEEYVKYSNESNQL